MYESFTLLHSEGGQLLQGSREMMTMTNVHLVFLALFRRTSLNMLRGIFVDSSLFFLYIEA